MAGAPGLRGLPVLMSTPCSGPSNNTSRMHAGAAKLSDAYAVLSAVLTCWACMGGPSCGEIWREAARASFRCMS
jgi:hypothetical protein